MSDPFHRLLLCASAMSILTFLLFGWDKLMAKHRRSRIPEAALLGAALCGGGIGGLLGMYLFRHKTRKPPFPLLVPLFALAQAAGLIWIRLH